MEASIKSALGKLDVDGSLVAAAPDAGFHLLSITATHAEVAGTSPSSRAVRRSRFTTWKCLTAKPP
jgi:hypothetical protein